ncbi:hypothetical protein AU195_00155 [Mycobacterium sp. IS-1496]|nr:hypothetical protein AU195_00155 [Mycobacterium sp. IS-1496]
MDIAQSLGAERLRELMTELLDCAGAAVSRYGGTLNQFTGDGIMALFGAPKALEDHARRACLAALDLQAGVCPLAAWAAQRDGVDFRLRVGLNSGVVVVGGVGSRPLSYTAIGRHVGMAQRMEAAAEPGTVLLSRSTALLVTQDFELGEPRSVHVKGSASTVWACPLVSIAPERRNRRQSRLVGRDAENHELVRILDHALAGSGATATIVGPPGIGKTRLTQETLVSASERGFAVVTTYCESHSRDVAFHVITRLLRSMFGLDPADNEAARIKVARRVHAAREDVLLLEDLLGIRDETETLHDMTPDTRGRRVVELVTHVVATWPEPAVYVVEDVHWIDPLSESMLGAIAHALSGIRAALVITYRPEYQGVLAGIPGRVKIVLRPLGDADMSVMTEDLLGADPSVRVLSAVVTERSGGIPFFAEEIVRDLAERREITGVRGAYRCDHHVADVEVPASLHAAIGARIDRLMPTAKRTLHAAAVIGSRFSIEMLERIAPDAEVGPLISAELVDRVPEAPRADYAFRHPLIRKVAYESQLRSARSELHRRVAAALEDEYDDGSGEGASLIATQFDAAGDLQDAYRWYMRAATWYGTRDIRAARVNWRLAQRCADRMPSSDTGRIDMQIAPRALLCGSAFQVGGTPADTGFDELRDLTEAAGDKKSLAIGMAGHLNTLTFNSFHREAADMASEFSDLVESMGVPAMAVGLLYGAAQAKWEAGEALASLRLSQRVIDLANGDTTMGALVITSPLAWSTTLHGASLMFLGRRGWRRGIDAGIAMARPFDATTRILAQVYKFAAAAGNHAILPDADDLDLTVESLEVARRSGDVTATTFATMVRAMALLHSPAGDRRQGLEMLATARDMLEREGLTVTLRRLTAIEFAREHVERAMFDEAIAASIEVLGQQYASGEMIFRGPATAVLVEALLNRGDRNDVTRAEEAIERLAAVPTDPGFVLHRLPLLRLRALLARRSGDLDGHHRLAARFRAEARRAEFEGLVAQADSLD